MKYVTLIALWVFSFSTPVYAEAPSCKALFFESSRAARPLAPSVGDQAFHISDLDREIPVLASRANFIRINGLLDISRLSPGEKPKQKNFLPLLNRLKTELEKINIAIPTDSSHPQKIDEAIYYAAKLSKFKKSVSDLIETSPDSVIDLESLNDLVYEALKFHTVYNDESLVTPMVTKSILLYSYPIFGTPHPETLLFLFSRGVGVWEATFDPKFIDGSPVKRNSFQVANHDGNHILAANQKNRSVTIGERAQFFDRLWKQFVNVENQTIRERELSIFLLHHAFYEIVVPMNIGGLKSYLENPKNLYHSDYKDWSFLERLNFENDLSSQILSERPVTESEARKTIEKLREWLSLQNP